MLLLEPDYYRVILIKLKSENLNETLRFIENSWENFSKDFPFEYNFLDERFERIYGDEIKARQVFSIFVIIAIFISCLGLLGLASFTAERRTKEIGIRKVLGATVPRIVFMLSFEFSKWILIANLIAWPLAYLAITNWLQNFAYKIELSLWTFVLAGGCALLIAFLTICWQVIRSATANPVESLRYEWRNHD